MRKILFVCTGNTCRSVMAEAFFNSMKEKHETIKNEYHACSAGILTSSGAPASENTLSVLEKEYGIDAGSHKSRTITDSDTKEAYLILAMTSNHKEHILARFPAAQDKTFTLGEYINEEQNNPAEGFGCRYDIPDPYGMPLQVYSFCASEIQKAVEKMIEKICGG